MNNFSMAAHSYANKMDKKYGLPKGTWISLLTKGKKAIQMHVRLGTWDFRRGQPLHPSTIKITDNFSYYGDLEKYVE
jgi:hypothetical protein